MTYEQAFPQRWQVKPNAKRILNKYESFKHLHEHIKQGSNKVITMCMNKHLLQGGTLQELVKLVQQDNHRLGSNDFLDEKRIEKHIDWCCDTKRGWIIEKNKYGVYRIVGYRGERDPHVDKEYNVQKSFYSNFAPNASRSLDKDCDDMIEIAYKKKIGKTDVSNDIFNRNREIDPRVGNENQRIETRIKNMISDFLNENKTWLSNAFKMTELISVNRGSRFGFEWPIQTSFGSFLLGHRDDGEVSSIGVGKQENNMKKYEISFVMSGKKIIIEIKTPAGGAISYVKTDVQKKFPKESLPFFLIFTDPKAPCNAPMLEGTSIVNAWVTHEEFRCYLYRKTP